MQTAHHLAAIITVIERLERRYNPENDIIPGTPAVTSTDMALVDITRSLLRITQNQQEQIDTLIAQVAALQPTEEEQAGKSYSEYFHDLNRAGVNGR